MIFSTNHTCFFPSCFRTYILCSCMFPVYYMTCPSHFSRSGINFQISPTAVTSSCVRPDISFNTLFSNIPRLCSSLNMGHNLFHSQTTEYTCMYTYAKKTRRDKVNILADTNYWPVRIPLMASFSWQTIITAITIILIVLRCYRRNIYGHYHWGWGWEAVIIFANKITLKLFKNNFRDRSSHWGWNNYSFNNSICWFWRPPPYRGEVRFLMTRRAMLAGA
jgi:hypothetical protein